MTEGRFDTFFKDPIYRLYKNLLYNYCLRREMIRGLLRGKKLGRILEAGCGISPMLDADPSVIQIDLSWKGLGLIREGSGKNSLVRQVACDATELPFANGVFDGVVCSEVIEHIKNDGRVLEEIHRVLRGKGELFLTCPVHQKFFGFDDGYVGHYRRYEVPNLKMRLEALGFTEFHVRPLLGRLEKQIMERVTRLFASFKRGDKKSRPLEVALRLLAWIFFPFYVLLNQAVAFVVRRQARSATLDQAVTVCLQCRKPA